VRRVVVAACVVVAAGAVIATALAADSGLECDDLRFDRAEWEELDRDEFADCVVEDQPFRGLEREVLVRRLGPPKERYGGALRWWTGVDEAFGMKVNELVIPIDDHGRAGRARVYRPG
jgi:hypothetical protein